MKTTIIFLLSTLIFSFSVKSQSIDSALINFNKKAPQEKVYVQFDNSKYTPGQTIWYKAYLMSGSQPSTISKNFYIDWYDNDGKLISSQVTPVIYSYAAANFKVPFLQMAPKMVPFVFFELDLDAQGSCPSGLKIGGELFPSRLIGITECEGREGFAA